MLGATARIGKDRLSIGIDDSCALVCVKLRGDGRVSAAVGYVASGRPGDELRDEPVGELRFKLVLKPANLLIDLHKDVLLDIPVELPGDELNDLHSDALNDEPENKPSDVLFD